MYRYTRADFDRVLEFVRGLYEPRTPEALREHLISALLDLVPAGFSISGSIEVGAAQQAHSARTNPPGFVTPELDAIVTRHIADNPMIAHFARTRSEQFARWSDLVPISRFVRSALYHEAYRGVGVRDFCTLLLYNGLHRIEGIAVGLNKQIPKAHRDILVSISPHLRQAFRSAHTTSALIEIAAMTSGPNRPERGIIAIDLNGTITMETPGASRLLEKFFGKRTMRGLPEHLAQWILNSDQALRKATDVPDVRHQLVIERAGDRLTIQMLSRPEQNFIVLEERRCAIDPEALSNLPLTRRESEILVYVAAGKTNPEIGIILGIRSRTVEKHVEHILERLGVETRTAAAAAAFEAANI